MTALAVPLVVCLLVGVLVDRALLGDPGLGPVERFGRGLALGLGVVGSLSMALDVAGAEAAVRTHVAEPLGIDELLLRLGAGAPELLAALSSLDLAGRVRVLPGRRYIRIE